VKRFVLDASALIAFFEDLPGAERVEGLIASAIDGKTELSMSIVNWGEVCYSIWRTKGNAAARKTVGEIAQLPINLVDANPELASLAVALRAEYKMPYSACFAAAMARQRRASLVTADKNFTEIEKQVVIVWVSN
jgi:predicted nucleic acid-binding protein